MNGPKVFKFTLPKVQRMILDMLKKNHLAQSDIDLLIPHQASAKGVEAYSKFGGFDQGKVMNIVNTTGNCVAASIPLCLAIALEKRIITKGDLIFLAGTGAGISIATAIIKL